MILLIAVLAGAIISWAFARWEGKPWRLPTFKTTILVVLGFLPQYLAIYLPATRRLFPDWLASLCLILSQILLLVFVIVNRHLPGMLVLMIGLGCNVLAILLNGGFMPLPIEAAKQIYSMDILKVLDVGQRISKASKDILLPDAQIILPWLADRFVPPASISLRFAFSLGDVFVALGAFWLLIQSRLSISPQT